MIRSRFTRSRRLDFDCLEQRTTPAAFSPATAVAVADAIQLENADFNGDNYLDLSVLRSDSFSILLSDGVGGFGSPETTNLSSTPVAFAVGDFTGDGDLDVIVAYNTTTTDTFLGNADGTFSAPTSSTFSFNVTKIAALKLNGDVYQDVVVGGAGGGTFALADNTGTGQLTGSGPFTAPGSTVVDFAIGDFDGDSDDDVAVVLTGATNFVSALYSNGAGSYSFRSLVSPTSTGVAVGDFDGDTIDDFVVSFSDSAPIIYRITGGNLVADAATLAALPVGSDIVALTINDDSVPDLAVFQAATNSLFVYGSDGVGSYTLDPDGADTVTAAAVIAADLNRDGYTDIVAANTAADTIDFFHCRFRTTTTITNVPATVSYGDALTITVQVLPTFDASESPAANYGKLRGEVEFYIDSVLAGTVTVSLLGQASLTVPTALAKLPVGTPSIVAKFTGGIFFRGSTSSAFQPTVNKGTVGAAIGGPTSSTYGDSVTFIVTLTPPELPPKVSGPTGMVSFFMDGSVPLGSFPVVETTSPFTYTVELQTNLIPAGIRTITANYLGDGNWNNASTSNNVVIVVAKYTPIIALTAAPTGPIAIGQNVDLTAAFMVPKGTSATGTADFVNNGSATLGSPAIAANSALLTTTLPVGNNTIVANYAGDDNFNAATSNSVSVSVGTPNEIYVANAYQLLLGRAPDPDAATWVNMLDAGISPSAIVLGIQGSIEYLNDVVDGLYQRYLGRPADPGSQTWVQQLASGFTIELVTAQICGSAEYSSLHPSNQDFVTALYLEVLGRSPDSAGEMTWITALANGESRTNVAFAFLTSTEYRNDLVAGYYTTFLGGNDPAGEAGWVNALAAGATDQQVLAGIFGSPQGYSIWSV